MPIRKLPPARQVAGRWCLLGLEGFLPMLGTQEVLEADETACRPVKRHRRVTMQRCTHTWWRWRITSICGATSASTAAYSAWSDRQTTVHQQVPLDGTFGQCAVLPILLTSGTCLSPAHPSAHCWRMHPLGCSGSPLHPCLFECQREGMWHSQQDSNPLRTLPLRPSRRQALRKCVRVQQGGWCGRRPTPVATTQRRRRRRRRTL